MIVFPDIPTVGNLIRYYRLVKHMQEEELANKVGISRYAIMRYEAGVTEPQLEDLQQIAKVLNVKLDMLCDEYFAFLAAPCSQIIKAIRKRLNMTQHELGSLLSVHKGTIKRWERGEHTVTREMWQKLKELIVL